MFNQYWLLMIIVPLKWILVPRSCRYSCENLRFRPGRAGVFEAVSDRRGARFQTILWCLNLHVLTKNHVKRMTVNHYLRLYTHIDMDLYTSTFMCTKCMFIFTCYALCTTYNICMYCMHATLCTGRFMKDTYVYIYIYIYIYI